MRPPILLSVFSLTWSLLSFPGDVAHGDVFSSNENVFQIELVTIGNPR